MGGGDYVAVKNDGFACLVAAWYLNISLLTYIWLPCLSPCRLYIHTPPQCKPFYIHSAQTSLFPLHAFSSLSLSLSASIHSCIMWFTSHQDRHMCTQVSVEDVGRTTRYIITQFRSRSPKSPSTEKNDALCVLSTFASLPFVSFFLSQFPLCGFALCTLCLSINISRSRYTIAHSLLPPPQWWVVSHLRGG